MPRALRRCAAGKRVWGLAGSDLRVADEAKKGARRLSKKGERKEQVEHRREVVVGEKGCQNPRKRKEWPVVCWRGQYCDGKTEDGPSQVLSLALKQQR